VSFQLQWSLSWSRLTAFAALSAIIAVVWTPLWLDRPDVLVISYLALFFSFLAIAYHSTNTIRVKKPDSELAIILLWILSLLLVLLVPKSINTASGWTDIGIMELSSGIAAVLLSAFLPGYGIFKSLKLDRRITVLELIVFSILTSMLMTSSLSFISQIVGSFQKVSFALITLMSSCILLLVVLRRVTEPLKVKREQLDIPVQIVLLIGVFISIFLGFYIVNYPLRMIPTIDQWFHFGTALRTNQDLLFDRYQAIYFNSLFDAMVLNLSDMRFANSYMLILPLGLLHIPAFYILSSSLAQPREAIASTVVYSLFSGLSGVLASYLQSSQEMLASTAAYQGGLYTSDGWAGALSYPLFYFPKSIGIAALLLAFYLVNKTHATSDFRMNVMLLTVTLVTGYLWHIAEVVFFLILSPLLLLILFTDRLRRKIIALSGFLTIAFVSLIDLVSPVKSYGLSFNGGALPFTTIAVLIGVAIALILAYATPWFRESYSHPKRTIELLYRVGVGALFAIGIIELFVWLSSWQLTAYYRFLGMFPEFHYPSRLGISLFLALLVLLFTQFKKLSHGMRMAVLMSMLSLGIARFSSWLQFSFAISFLSEARIVEFVWPWIALLSGVFLVRLSRISEIRPPKSPSLSIKVLSTSLLIAILIIGYSSKSYEIAYRSSSGYSLTTEDVNLVSELPRIAINESVFAPGITNNVIRDFSGSLTIDTYQDNTISDLILLSENMLELATVLNYNAITESGSYPGSYVQLPSLDWTTAAYQDKYFIKHLLPYLQYIENNSIQIVDVPSLNPASRNPQLLLALPVNESSSESTNLLLNLLAIGDYPYDIVPTNSVPMDGTISALLWLDHIDVPLEIWNWVSDGGQIVLLNSSIISLMNNSIQECDAIWSQDYELITHSWVPTNFTATPTTEVISWYRSGTSNILPFAEKSEYGQGFILNVTLWPLLSHMAANRMVDESRSQLIELVDLWDLAGLPSPNSYLKSGIGLGAAWNSIEMEGNISLTSRTSTLTDSCLVQFRDPLSGMIRNETLKSIEIFGEVGISMISDQLSMTSDASPLGAIVSSDIGLNLNVEIGSSASVVLNISNETDIERISFASGLFSFNLTSEVDDVSIRVSGANFSCHGITRFAQLYSGWPFDVYVPKAYADFQGNTSFHLLSSGDAILINEIEVNGTFVSQSSDVESYIASVYAHAFGNPNFQVLGFGSVLLFLALFCQRRQIHIKGL
jgi:hypothetical protein